MPTGPSGGSSCAERWPSSSAGTAPASSISPCTAEPSLCEAALDTYLPLLERLEELAGEGTDARLTIGFTPVLANQLASPTFAREMAAFFAQRLAACDEAPASLATTGDQALLPLVDFWR